jgi:hypothetical protein
VFGVAECAVFERALHLADSDVELVDDVAIALAAGEELLDPRLERLALGGFCRFDRAALPSGLAGGVGPIDQLERRSGGAVKAAALDVFDDEARALVGAVTLRPR